MSELPHEHTPDTAEFLTATLKVVDQEYDYIAEKVGQEQILRTIDQKVMAHSAFILLESAYSDDFLNDDSFSTDTETGVSSEIYEASLEHLRLLSDTLGAINGYRLTLMTDKKMILDQVVRTKDNCLVVISLEASLSPLGVHVAKDRHIARDRLRIEKDTLEVGPEDISVIDQFIQKIIAL